MNRRKFSLDDKLANDAAIARQMHENEQLQQLRNWVRNYDRDFFNNVGRKLKID